MAKAKKKKLPIVKKNYSSFEYHLVKNQLDQILNSPEWAVARAVRELIDNTIYEHQS